LAFFEIFDTIRPFDDLVLPFYVSFQMSCDFLELAYSLKLNISSTPTKRNAKVI